MSTCPAISRTRRRCENALVMTKPTVMKAIRKTGQGSSRPISGIADQTIASTTNARNQAMARRPTKKKLLITGIPGGVGCCEE